MEGFWMVLGNGVPTYRHTTLMSARTEAERLARLHPGSSFTILKSVATVVRSDVKWTPHTWTGTNGNEVPF